MKPQTTSPRPPMHPTPPMPWLNCDLGEGEPRALTRSLIAHVDLANIACGGHAGDRESMTFCLERARAEAVRAGAHPGIPRPGSFGRGTPDDLTADALQALLDEQVGRLLDAAAAVSVPVLHLKLHGTLYHQVDADPGLGRAYVDHVRRRWPGLAIVARTGGGVVEQAREWGHPVLREGFLDRGYRADGTLVPRGNVGDLLHDPRLVLDRLQSLQTRGGWPAVDGAWVALEADTLCVHGDSPGALRILESLRRVFPRPPAARQS